MSMEQYARMGAAVRLGQIEAEAAGIRKAFPGLKLGRVEAAPKRTFSAAAKRRMSAGMRAFWKRRKAAQLAREAKPKASSGKGKAA